jgi:hypothetical protein
MKKAIIVIIVAISMLSLFILTLVGSIEAYDAGFTQTDYNAIVTPTIDGQYAIGDEWGGSLATTFGTNGIFRNEWLMATNVYENLLIETADATNDAEDYWEICYDGNAGGGATPQTDDYRIVVTGHGATATVTWYQGTGTGWNAITTPPATSFTQAQSLSSSPRISEPHYILEMTVWKNSAELGGTFIIDQYFAMRVAYYDAHADGNGLQAWPPAPATRDAPDGWGYVTYVYGEQNPNPDVPEGFGVGVVLTSSSVAIVAGAVLLRKRPISQPIAKLS